MRFKDIATVLKVSGTILAVPLVAMQFSSEVDWDLRDFLIMGVLLICTGLLIALALRKGKGYVQKLVVVSAIVAFFLLVWIQLAVGIVNDWPFGGT